METAIASVAAWATSLAVERWPEIVVGIAMLAVWRWFMGHKFQKRLEALERKQSDNPSVTVDNNYGTINLIRTADGYEVQGMIPDPVRVSGIGETPIGSAMPLRVKVGLGEAKGLPIQGAEIERKKASDG